MAPNAGDRHFRVFRVPASVFQVPVGGDGRPLADVLRGERAPMDALHRRPEAACPNVWQRIGVSEHNGRQAGAVPVMEPPPRVGASPTIHGNGRPPVVPDGPPRRYGGGGILQKCGVSERKGQRGGGDVVAAVRGKGIPASYGGGGMARRVEDVPRRRSALFCLPQ